jgi:hypothetical protein
VAASSAIPRVGAVATVRNRRGLIAGVEPFDGDAGRLHLVDVEYKDDQLPLGEKLIWGLEPRGSVLEPTALPQVSGTDPMPAEDFDAVLRATRWTATSPYLDPDGEGPVDPLDAHDVVGTWRIVSDVREMRRTPEDGAALTRLIKARHAAIMESRPDKRPGQFKLAESRAGSTVFVAPDLVAGTLEQGFDLCRSLETPFERAVFMMFLVSEVHPFADGNGRTARIMMNAELVAAGEERIVILTVYRANYLSALKALSQNGLPEPLIRMLDYAQKWTAAIDWRSVDETRRELDDCNAFLDPSVADEEGKRLRMPGRAEA